MNNLAKTLFQEGQGILRLAPAWVPRAFCRPGRRLRLHPDDYYALGLKRGGIDERWLASTTSADNGPDTPHDEGLSYAVCHDGSRRVLLSEAVDALQGELIGEALWNRYKRWPVFSKFFDNLGPLPHHIHHDDDNAARVGMNGKPEMYFFPAQMNNHGGEFPFTFFGLNPEVTRDEVRSALESFGEGDNRLLELSRAYKLQLDTGWDVPTGLLHAPGSLCTYEPQFASDVFAMYQSMLYFDHAVPEELLWKNCPPEERDSVDFMMELIDWPLNTDRDMSANRLMKPQVIHQDEGYCEEWICYRSKVACAKRLTVNPGQTVRVSDEAAYGLILLEGYGKMGSWTIETPTLIRYGALTLDEFFVSEGAARSGVTIVNASSTQPLVMLKHFAENPELARWQAEHLAD